MRPLLTFSVRRPGLVVVLATALALLAGLFIPGIELRLDGRSLIPAQHPAMGPADEAAARFALRDVVVLAVADRRSGIYTPQALDLLRRLSDELAGVEGIEPGSVSSLATVPRLAVDAGVLEFRPLLADPRLDAARIRRLREETDALGLDDGLLVARDGRAAAVLAEVRPEADRSRLRRRIAELTEGLSADGLEVHASGTALAQAVLGEAAARDLGRLIPLVVALVGALLVVAFRHPVPALIGIAEVGTGLVWTIGLMGALGQQVFVTTLALPAVLFVIGISDDVYALRHYLGRRQDDPRRPASELAVEALVSVQRPLLLTTATTMLGLLCLTATGLRSQFVFGVFGALSVMLSTFLTFTLVPALLVLLDPRPRRAGTGRSLAERLAAPLAAVQRVGGRRALLLALAAAVASGSLLRHLQIGDNWIRNLPPESEVVRGDRAINELLAGTNTLELMLDSGRSRGWLDDQAFAALGRFEDALLSSPDVGAVEGAYTQVVRAAAALDGTSYRPFRAALAAAERRLSEAEVEQTALLLESLRHSPLVRRFDPEYRRTRMTVVVRSADYGRVEAVLRRAEEARREHLSAAALTPFGDGWTGYVTIRILALGQLRSMALAVLFDALVLSLLFGSIATAAVAISPVVLAVMLVLAGLVATGTPLGTANSMFAAIALGIGVDYSIHLVAYHRQALRRDLSPREAMRVAISATGPSIVISALSLALGFSALGVSEVLPNRELGWLVAASLATCAALTLLLVPNLALLGEGRR